MHSFLSDLSRSDGKLAVSPGRPEALRRATIATNAQIITAASVVLAVPAFYMLTLGMLMPFVLAVLGLAIGSLTLGLQRWGHHERAAVGQVYGILLIGLVLTAVDPALADFGLAVSLLGPVHASLLTRSAMKKWSWVLLVGVVLMAALGALGVHLWPEGFAPQYSGVSAIVFGIVAVVVAYSANRLNSVFEVYEKSQISAYRHLVEHVQDAVMRFSAEGEVIFVSRSSETLFGCRRFELTGNGLLERVHVLDRPAYMTAFADANRGGKPRTVEVRMRRDDTSAEAGVPRFVWVEASLSPIVDGEVVSERHEVVALFRDITERKDHETQMGEAKRLAEAASEAKSRFLATIGHELRTPLNAIVGFSEMMTSGVVGELAPAHKEYAGLIHRSGMHLIDVVQMLLDMSKIEAGKYELQTESFEPEGLVEPCFQMVDALARSKNVRLEAQTLRKLPSLVADERSCRQILINLLSNAIKFSHQGGTVSIGMKRQGRFLNLSVTDYGIGMSPEVVKRVGEPFFQAEDGISRSYEGTGLGLSIVKGLVDLHQGELHVTSARGEGTTVTVLLPLNGPAIKSVESGEVTQLHPGPHGTTQEEKNYDGNHSVASAAASR